MSEAVSVADNYVRILRSEMAGHERIVRVCVARAPQGAEAFKEIIGLLTPEEIVRIEFDWVDVP